MESCSDHEIGADGLSQILLLELAFIQDETLWCVSYVGMRYRALVAMSPRAAWRVGPRSRGGLGVRQSFVVERSPARGWLCIRTDNKEGKKKMYHDFLRNPFARKRKSNQPGRFQSGNFSCVLFRYAPINGYCLVRSDSGNEACSMNYARGWC